MNIQELKLSFPYDFLEHLIKARHDSKSQYFISHIGGKEDSINLIRTPAPLSVTATSKLENVSISISTDIFQCKDGILRCAFNTWEETKETFITKTNAEQTQEHLSDSPESELKKCTVVLHDILDNTSKTRSKQADSGDITPQSEHARKELSQFIRNKPGSGLKSRKREADTSSPGPAIKKDKVSPALKTRQVNVEQKGLTPKVRKYATKSKHLPTTTKVDFSVHECEKQDLMKSINLRPRINTVDWSALVKSDDSHDSSDDLGEFSPDTSPVNTNVGELSAQIDPDQVPEGKERVKMQVLPIIITVAPSGILLKESASPLPHPAAVKTSHPLPTQTALLSPSTVVKLPTRSSSQKPFPSPAVGNPPLPPSSVTLHSTTPAKTLRTQSTPSTPRSQTILKKTLLSTPSKLLLSQPIPTKVHTSKQTPLLVTPVQKLLPQPNNDCTQLSHPNQDNASLPSPSLEEAPLCQGKTYKPILPKMGMRIAQAITPVDTRVKTNVPKPHVSMSKVFPVQVVPGRFQLTEGQDGQLTLSAHSETNSDVFEGIEDINVSFYTNISKGIERCPLDYPTEFKPVMIQDDISLPIVINIRKEQVQKKKEFLGRKLVTQQEKIVMELASDLQGTSEAEYSANDNVSDLNIETDSSTGAPASAEHGFLKEKMASDTLKTFILLLPSDISSEDSEADYTDETELLRPPRLSVVYSQISSVVDLNCKQYTKLGVGNYIPGIEFLINSSVLLKTLEDRYYVQGEVEDVEGTVLLGPFALIFHPLPCLNFVKVVEPATRVPRCIYERRRKRWLKKHDRKRFTRPRGGAPADKNLVVMDHDYFTDQSDSEKQKMETKKDSGKEKDGQRETTPQPGSVQDIPLKDEDVFVVSVRGVDPVVVEEDEDSVAVEEEEDEDLYTYNKDTELQIPVVGSLGDALGNTEKERVVPRVSDSIHEAVSFDEVPAVVAESTLASVGVQINYRLLGKQSIDWSRLKRTPVVENDDSHHMPMRFTCRYCLKSVVDNFRLAEHIRACHHDKRGFIDYARQVRFKEGFRCQYCDKAPMFHSHDSIRNHLRVHHPDKVSIPEPFISRRTCQTCKKVFSTRSVLLTHIRRMHEHKRLLCDKCPGIFKSEQGLRDHMNGMHDNIRNYICHICGSAYVINDYLRRHIKRVHNKSKKSDETNDMAKPEKRKRKHGGEVKKCSQCRYSFDSINMKKHLKQIHGVTKIIDKKCPDCSQTFASRSLLECHRCTTHDYAYQLSCPFCGIAYVHYKAMQDHVLTIHLGIKLHQCAMCDKIFPRPSPLIDHMLTEHKGKSMLEENRRLKCQHCSDIFGTHKALVEHVLSPSHRELFPHRCPTCAKRFMHENVLNHHIKILHCNDVEFEIRCNSDKDMLVQMVVKQDVQNLEDLPPKAQQALKRLQSEGKHVMIVSKRDDKKDQGSLEQTQNKPKTVSDLKTDINSNGKKSMQRFTHNASPKVQAVTRNAGSPSKVNHTGLVKKSDIESLKIYKIAAKSGETSNAVSIIHHQQLVEGTNVVAEEIGRLDEGGNVVEDRGDIYAMTNKTGRQGENESGLGKYVLEEDTGKEEERVLGKCVVEEQITMQEQSVLEKYELTQDTGRLEERVTPEIYVIQEEDGRLNVNERVPEVRFVVTEDIGCAAEGGNIEVESTPETTTVLEEKFVVGKDNGQPLEGGNIVVERIENYMVPDNMGRLGVCGGNLENSAEQDYMVAEQIGRLDEDGNVVEDRVVFEEEEHVSDLLYFLQNQS
ncbi:uncharacterized protein LOC124111158 [Haliotis rufescens]|uniref:uncharacterized protein LOC124111158 n=1 Tax=Haliotis rufescens TaxID=6454 RepID=UPI00201ECAFB|nr:uncharacterized protein LOC124111158 [Haliotis rufescens]